MGSSLWKQPGPMEAMKQMLFKLQAVEAELQQQHQASVVSTVNDELQKVEITGRQEVSQASEVTGVVAF